MDIKLIFCIQTENIKRKGMKNRVKSGKIVTDCNRISQNITELHIL